MRGRFVIVLLGLGILGGSAPRAEIVVGPCVQNVASESAVILWETTASAESRVDHGPDPGLGTTTSGPASVTLHEVPISGLTPGARTHYRVTSGSDVSAVYSFTTPSPEAALVRFVVIGDTRSSTAEPATPTAFETVAASLAASSPEFILHAGDIVLSGSERAQWTSHFFDPAGDVFARIPIFPAMGNHDLPGVNYADYFSLPAEVSTEEWYSFDWGGVHLVSVNTNASFASDSAQCTWLAADLQAAASGEWTVVYYHHGAHSSVRDNGETLRTVLRPLLEAHGVDVIFNGHDHLYERSVVNGIPHVITGGGGAELYPPDLIANPEQVIASSEYHHTLVEATRVGEGAAAQHTLRAWAHSVDGEVLDTFTLTRMAVPTGLSVSGSE